MKKKPIRKIVRKPKPVVQPEPQEIELSFRDRISINILLFKMRLNTFLARVKARLF
jgi:hypothetical protein